MKIFFVLLVLSSMFPLCAMDQEARGDESEAFFAKVAWEGYIQELQEQLSRLKDSSSIDEHLAEVYESILSDARQGTLKNATTTLQWLQEEFNNLCFAKGLPHSASAPADLPAVGGAGGILKRPLAGMRTRGKEGSPVSFKEEVAVAEFFQSEPVSFFKECLKEDEDGSADSSGSDGEDEGDSSDSAASGDRSSDEESDTKIKESDALWDRIYNLQGKWGIDVTYLENALGDPDANFDDVKAMIAECENVVREDEESEIDDSEWSVEEGADDRDGDAPSGEAPEAPEWLVDVQRRISELMAGQLVDVTGLLQEALSIKAGDKDSSEKIQDLLRRIAEVEEMRKAALASDDEEEDSSRDPKAAALDAALPFSPLAGEEVAATDEGQGVYSDDSGDEASSSAEEGPPAPAPSPETPSDEDADGRDALPVVAEAVSDYEGDGGRIGDLDDADSGKADLAFIVDERVVMEKQLELAGRLGSLQKRDIEVANLWERLGREETELAVLEKEIDALEEQIRRTISSPLSPASAEEKTGNSSPSFGWWRRVVQPLVLGKVAGVTFGAFVIGGWTHRHVRTRRAQGKPTVFDRMWSTSKEWKKKAERLVRRS